VYCHEPNRKNHQIYPAHTAHLFRSSLQGLPKQAKKVFIIAAIAPRSQSTHRSNTVKGM